MGRWRSWGLLLLVLGCGTEGVSDADFDTRNDQGKPNGERCLFTPAGARICSGLVCRGYLDQAGPFGLCSEACGSSCRFGGICVSDARVVPPLRYCLLPCERIEDCGVGLGCLPLDATEICDEAGCHDAAGTFFCTPLPPAGGPDAG